MTTSGIYHTSRLFAESADKAEKALRDMDKLGETLEEAENDAW